MESPAKDHSSSPKHAANPSIRVQTFDNTSRYSARDAGSVVHNRVLILIAVVDAFVPLCYGSVPAYAGSPPKHEASFRAGGGHDEYYRRRGWPHLRVLSSGVHSTWAARCVNLLNSGNQCVVSSTFVLETKRKLFRSKLVASSTIILTFRVVHFGAFASDPGSGTHVLTSRLASCRGGLHVQVYLAFK